MRRSFGLLIGLGMLTAAGLRVHQASRTGELVVVHCWHFEEGPWSSDTTCTRTPVPVVDTITARRDSIARPAGTPERARPAEQPSTIWLEEDFSKYRTTEDLLRYPNPKWSGACEDAGVRSIALDPVGPPVGGQSMRYDFRDRTGRPGLCHDYTIGRNVQFPAPTSEVWLEVWFKFSPNWETMAPGCGGVSSNGYKFLFGRVPVDGRFALIVGVYRSHSYSIEYPGGGTAYEGRGPGNISWERITDGNWHLLQQHLRVSSVMGARDGLMETRIDGTVLRSFRNVAIHSRDIYGLALGRNLNQGPTQAQSLWWGRIRLWKTDPGWGF